MLSVIILIDVICSAQHDCFISGKKAQKNLPCSERNHVAFRRIIFTFCEKILTKTTVQKYKKYAPSV